MSLGLVFEFLLIIKNIKKCKDFIWDWSELRARFELLDLVYYLVIYYLGG